MGVNSPALTPRRADTMTPLQMEKSLTVLGLVVEGKGWAAIKEETGTSWSVFSRWMVKYPDLGRSYQEARALSGTTFEDKALALADKLVAPNDFTGTGVRALEVAMNQYRWSATKRDPRSYAEATASTGAQTPIQINTTLNLGQPGAEQIKVTQNIFDFAADIARNAQSAPPEADLVVEGEILPPDPPSPPSGLPEALEQVREKVHLPLEPKAALKKRPSPGRPKKGHKNAFSTGTTRATYDRMKKSPSVRAALGLPQKDEEDGSVEHDGDKPSGLRGAERAPRK
jgi:hypothetical protein